MIMRLAWMGACLVLLSSVDAWAQNPAIPPASVSEAKMETLKQPRDFQNANLRETLNYLAQQANVTLELKKEITGSFSVRIDEPVIPFEALRRIADQLHLLIEKKDPSSSERIYTIWAKADFKPSPGAQPEPTPDPQTDGFGAMFSGMGPAVANMVVRMDDDVASYLAKPETAAKRAKFYRNLYDALVKEGFSKDDALKMTLATAYPSLSSDKTSSSK